MARKKSQLETAPAIVVDEDELLSDSQKEQKLADIRNKLAEIRKDKGIKGYILRNTNTATIDLEEPEKIVGYALFSSQVLDSSGEISDLFELGDVESILIEGKGTNARCIKSDDNKICIFMEKTAKNKDIFKKISP